MNNTVDAVFDVCLKHKDLLNRSHAHEMKAIIARTLAKYREDKKAITNDNIKRVFFGGLDFSRFSTEDTEAMIDNIRSIVTAWEENS